MPHARHLIQHIDYARSKSYATLQREDPSFVPPTAANASALVSQNGKRQRDGDIGEGDRQPKREKGEDNEDEEEMEIDDDDESPLKTDTCTSCYLVLFICICFTNLSLRKLSPQQLCHPRSINLQLASCVQISHRR